MGSSLRELLCEPKGTKGKSQERFSDIKRVKYLSSLVRKTSQRKQYLRQCANVPA